VNPSTRVAIGLGAAGACMLTGVWVWSWIKRWRQKDPVEVERLRRLEINRRGRIIAGRIVDLIESESGLPDSRLLVYKYEIAGVTYEAAQDIHTLPRVLSMAPFLLGQTASVKYDPQKPTNSIIACEQWDGLPSLEASGEVTSQLEQTPSKPDPA
jgi:hypothetical protein